MLKRARKAVAKRSNVELILGDWPEAASNLPTVDAVVLNMVLHHLPAPASAIRAAAEQLQAGGTLLITDLCRHDQHWAHETCGDFWLGFDETDLVDWAGRAGPQLPATRWPHTFRCVGPQTSQQRAGRVHTHVPVTCSTSSETSPVFSCFQLTSVPSTW